MNTKGEYLPYGNFHYNPFYAVRHISAVDVVISFLCYGLSFKGASNGETNV